MIIERRKLDDLHSAAYNPRQALAPGDAEFEKLLSSIKTFGNVEPILWNRRTGNITGGHQRYEVLKHIGETETDVVVVDLSLEEEKLLNVALNKIKGEWDYDKLSSLLSQFDPVEAKMSGFSPQEIMLLVAQASAQISEYNINDSSKIGAESEIDNVDEDENEPHPQAGDFVDVSESEDNGLSWLVTISFQSLGRANTWLEEHGFSREIKEGRGSTVIRMGERDD